MGFRGAVRMGGAAAAIALAAMPAAAQFSDRYNFLKAIRDRDGTMTLEYLNKPGTPELNSRDSSTGESALHITVKRHDTVWTNALLARGANTELRDNAGETPLLAAARLSDADTARLLLSAGAKPNATDGQGETPLIIAVQHRDLPTIRVLLAGGADPKIADRVAGKTARDYAAEDNRGGGAVLKLLDDAKPKPSGPISGPVPN